MAIVAVRPQAPAPPAPPRRTFTQTNMPRLLGYGPNSPQVSGTTYPGIVSPYAGGVSNATYPGVVSPLRMQSPNPMAQANQTIGPVGLGGVNGNGWQQFRPAPAYNGATYTGKVTGMPYGQANAMTWQSIGGMLGMSPQQLGDQLMKLTPFQRAAAANFAQNNLGVAVPGSGQGVTVNRPAPVYNQTPLSSPMSMAQFNSRLGGIQNLVNQRLGR